MIKFSKEIPAKSVDIRVDEINISLANKVVYLNINDGDSNRIESISLLDIFLEDDAELTEALRKVVSRIIDIKYQVDTSGEKDEIFKDVEHSLVEDWVKPAGAHDAYNIGDKAKFDGVVYRSTIDGNVWDIEEYPEGWVLD